MSKAVLFRINKQELGAWKAWCADVATVLLDEAKASLVEESVRHEVSLCFQIGDEWYGLGYMNGQALSANPDREINKRHSEMKKRCLTYISAAEVLYDIEA